MTPRLPGAIHPPATLNANELAVWRATIAGAPAGWFLAEQFPLLAAYCGHVVEAERLHRAARGERIGTPEHGKLTRLACIRSGMVLSFARALRLTTQSRASKYMAGSRARAQKASPGTVSELLNHD